VSAFAKKTEGKTNSNSSKILFAFFIKTVFSLYVG